MISHKSSKNFFIILLIYSVAVHAAIVIAAAGKYRADNGTLTITLDKKVKVPFALKTSLTGRRGNTYNPEALKNAIPAGEIKKLFREKSEAVISKYEDIAKMLKSQMPSLPPAPAVEKKADAPKPKQAPEPPKKVATARPVDKNINSKPRAAEKKKPEPPKKESETAESEKNSKPAAEPDAKPAVPAFSEGDGTGDNKNATTAAIFGNMAGTETSGNKIAGTPDGELNPDIEAKSIDIFKASVVRKIKENLKYPERCKRDGAEGSVRVRFLVEKNGAVSQLDIVESSSNDELDQAARSAILNSQPFKPFPQSAKELSFIIPLNFNLE